MTAVCRPSLGLGDLVTLCTADLIFAAVLRYLCLLYLSYHGSEPAHCSDHVKAVQSCVTALHIWLCNSSVYRGTSDTGQYYYSLVHTLGHGALVFLGTSTF